MKKTARIINLKEQDQLKDILKYIRKKGFDFSISTVITKIDNKETYVKGLVITKDGLIIKIGIE